MYIFCLTLKMKRRKNCVSSLSYTMADGQLLRVVLVHGALQAYGAKGYYRVSCFFDQRL